jgi:hypothetical protein
MYRSLEKHCNDFHLFVFAFDDLSFELLKQLNLGKASIIALREFESPDLLKVKPNRSIAEYCWTCTPSIIKHVFQKFNVKNCTYLDADLFFYNSPAILIEELTDKHSVLITEHRYSLLARMRDEERAGRFCVQFITFTDSPESQNVLDCWKNQCIDWCYARFEDGKFGDQKYLDEWPHKYQNVKILEHLGGGVAPWNVQQYQILENNNKISGIDKKTKIKFDIIFFHFHFIRFLENDLVDLGWDFLSNEVINQFYIPYIKLIAMAEKELKGLNSGYKPFIYPSNISGGREAIKKFIKNITKYNLLRAS